VRWIPMTTLEHTTGVDKGFVALPDPVDVASQLSTPANSSTIVTEPTVSWSRTVNAARYHLIVSMEADFTPQYVSVFPDYIHIHPTRPDCRILTPTASISGRGAAQFRECNHHNKQHQDFHHRGGLQSVPPHCCKGWHLALFWNRLEYQSPRVCSLGHNLFLRVN
jgi:hypothetical protein